MESLKPRVAVVGAGRAGSALATALTHAGYTLTAIHSRRTASAAALADEVGATVVATALAAVRSADVTLITVPDAAIPAIGATVAASGMALRGHALLHCCASRDRQVLAAARSVGAAVGAMHPLQSLSGSGSAELLRGSLFAVDVDPGIAEVVTGIVDDLGGLVTPLASTQRALYHAAAALAGNTPMVLLARSVDLLVSAGMDRTTATRGLAHLMAGSLSNAGRAADVRGALTGPVVRDDAQTVARHLTALRSADPDAFDLYVILSDALLDIAGRSEHPAVAATLAAARGSATRRRRSAA